MVISMYLLGMPCGVISATCLKGGETTNWFCTSSNLISSSKYSLILLALKLVLRFSGSLRTNTGGSTSLGPPVGDPLLAHCHRARTIREKKNKPKILLMYRIQSQCGTKKQLI